MTNKQKQDLAGLVSNPKTDFSRNRKIPYEKMILSFYGSSGIGGIKGGTEWYTKKDGKDVYPMNSIEWLIFN